MAAPWRIVFFGTSAFSLPTLERLLESNEKVVAVVTQPDRARGRGQKMASSPVKTLASSRGIPILQPERVKEEAFQAQVRDLRSDLFVVVAYGQILPKSLLDLPEHGAVNVHASLLPKYRGAAPIPWAILQGEKVTGVTTMLMDEGMDTGDILLQEEVLIGDRDTTETLQGRLARTGAQLLMNTLERLKAGALRPVPQDSTKASYAPMLKKEDGWIEWAKDAVEIDRQVRALNPWPGVFTRWNGRRLKICQGEFREGLPEKRPGTITWVAPNGLEVQTGKGRYLIQELQLEGKRRMSVKDFLLGHPISIGTTFGE